MMNDINFRLENNDKWLIMIALYVNGLCGNTFYDVHIYDAL